MAGWKACPTEIMDYLILGYLLILAGFVLMAAELVLYSHGVLSMIGLGSMITGAVFVFGRDPFLGMVTLLLLFIAVPICGKVLLHYWPQTPIGKKFVLQPPTQQTTIAQSPQAQEMETLRGRFGKTLSALRPAGMVDFDGHRIDALTEGTMIDAGQWVRCIDVRAGTVVVRLSEAPPAAGSLEEMKF